MEDLAGFLCVAFRDCARGNAFALGVHAVAVGVGDGRKAGCAAADQSGFFGYGEASFERPVGDFFRGRAGLKKRGEAFVFEGVGDDGFENSACRHQREIVIALIERTAAIGIRVLEDRTNLGVVNEVEAVRGGLLGGGGDDCALVGARQRCDGLAENCKQLLNDFRGSGALRGTPIGRPLEEGFAEGAGEPVSFAASGELIDGDAAVFLPPSRGCHGSGIRGLGGQCVAELVAAFDETIEVV